MFPSRPKLVYIVPAVLLHVTLVILALDFLVFTGR